MKYQLICTSYTVNLGAVLVFRNNWIESVKDDNHLSELLVKWQLPDDFKYPMPNSISEILVGKMDLENVVIHVRIIRFA